MPPLLIAEHGAVSKQVATAMAEGIRKRCRSVLGVGITGVAGPTGGTEEKPVGLVYIAAGRQPQDGSRPSAAFPATASAYAIGRRSRRLDMIRRRLI